MFLGGAERLVRLDACLDGWGEEDGRSPGRLERPRPLKGMVFDAGKVRSLAGDESRSLFAGGKSGGVRGG